MFRDGTSSVYPLLEAVYPGKEASASREVGLRYHSLHMYASGEFQFSVS